MGSYRPGVGLNEGSEGDVGASARDAEGNKPSEPGMILASSDKLQTKLRYERTELHRTLHVTEQVFSKNNTVQLPGISDDVHGGSVDKLMLEFDLRILLRQGLCDNLPPEPGTGKDVGLVDGVDRKGRVSGESDLCCNSSDPLHFSYAVHHRIVRAITIPLFFAWTIIKTADEFANNDDVDTLRDLRL